MLRIANRPQMENGQPITSDQHYSGHVIVPLTNDGLQAKKLEKFNRAISTLLFLTNFDCTEDSVRIEVKNKVELLMNPNYSFIYTEVAGTKGRVGEVIATLKPLFTNDYNNIFDLLANYTAQF